MGVWHVLREAQEKNANAVLLTRDNVPVTALCPYLVMGPGQWSHRGKKQSHKSGMDKETLV